jgi:hypothetical protein
MKLFPMKTRNESKEAKKEKEKKRKYVNPII